MLERLFKLSEHNTNVKTELVAGLTTFLTMAYILFVNPDILSATGMDKGSLFTATALAAAFGCLVMGLVANFPVALAPAMGLNAFFAFTVCGSMGYTWQEAMAAVFVAGIVFFLLSAFKIREWIMNSIPKNLRFGIAAGIGLFLSIIALKNSGMIVDHPATFVTLGDFTQIGPLLAAVGLFIILALEYRKVPGDVLISVLIVTAISVVITGQEVGSLVSLPPSVAPTFWQMDFSKVMEGAMISVIFAFVFVDLFDTSGTLLAVAQKAELVDEDGKIENIGKAMVADSAASVAGAALGASTVTSYVESASGIAQGGRTGLTAVVVGLLFLLALFFAPIAGLVPSYATAPALLYVAVLMMSELRHVEWDDLTEAAPVFVAALGMPLTFSIADGIGLAFITYALGKAVTGRYKDVSPAVWLVAFVFALKLAHVF
ncbi:NCS2 family permease [Litoribacillus peritrichatus]|uniref:NCS2 family permease n=1 Tax=Litoribacillus peritrichatus TaxID=718191 RepID=A0ABP7M5U5_9GAMM